MRKWLLVAFIFGYSVVAQPLLAQDLTVAVAANAQQVFERLRSEFEKESGIKIAAVIGSSGKLTSQIEHGAPFDVFLSADSEYPARLFLTQFATNAPRIYARGVLALWTATGAPISQRLLDLTSAKIKRIAIADPTNAPYGRETVVALRRLGLYDKLKEKIVFAESIAQVNQYVTIGSVDVGFTSLSSVTALDPVKTKACELNRDDYTPIPQAAVILRHGYDSHREASEKFFAFLFSPLARDIFRTAGYLDP